LTALAGSGPGGAVVAADVEASRAEAPGAPVSGVWRVMAERTTASWQSVPHFYLRREVDATRLESWRSAARGRPGQERVSYTDLLVKLAAEALRRHPRVNSTWSDGAVAPGARINVGVAVAVPDGLVVPVVHDADHLSLAETLARRVELVDAARAGRLRPEDVTGGTFTISNLGMYGVDSFDAIVNAPQAAILAVGRIVDRVVPVDGQPAVRPVMHLSISFDHRVVDGARGAEFLDTLASLIEEPAGLVG
ncbi:MAG TPA: dihydrolipoamide acetyltransferase family protein, partial [Gaiellaceae bacterium]